MVTFTVTFHHRSHIHRGGMNLHIKRAYATVLSFRCVFVIPGNHVHKQPASDTTVSAPTAEIRSTSCRAVGVKKTHARANCDTRTPVLTVVEDFVFVKDVYSVWRHERGMLPFMGMTSVPRLWQESQRRDEFDLRLHSATVLHHWPNFQMPPSDWPQCEFA